GIFVRHYFGNAFSLRGNFFASELKGDDAQFSTPSWRQHRNFSFTSQLYEASAMLECDILRHYRKSHSFRYGIYAFAGIGACYTNPQRNFNRSESVYFDADDK